MSAKPEVSPEVSPEISPEVSPAPADALARALERLEASIARGRRPAAGPATLPVAAAPALSPAERLLEWLPDLRRPPVTEAEAEAVLAAIEWSPPSQAAASRMAGEILAAYAPLLRRVSDAEATERIAALAFVLRQHPAVCAEDARPLWRPGAGRRLPPTAGEVAQDLMTRRSGMERLRSRARLALAALRATPEARRHPRWPLALRLGRGEMAQAIIEGRI